MKMREHARAESREMRKADIQVVTLAKKVESQKNQPYLCMHLLHTQRLHTARMYHVDLVPHTAQERGYIHAGPSQYLIIMRIHTV